MNVAAFMADLAKQGVKLWADGEQLRYRAPKGVMTASLRSKLAEHKTELLTFLSQPQPHDRRDSALCLSASQPHPSRLPHGPIVPAPAQMYQPFPTTDVQQAYWIGRNSSFELGNVGSQCYFEVEAVALDFTRSLLALRRLIKRHPMLRAVILPDGQQQVLESVPLVCVEVIDLSGLHEPDLQAQLRHIRQEIDHQVFQAEQWPVWAVRVSRLHERRVRIHVNIESLFIDAGSMRVLLQEFIHLYHEPEASLPPLELSFRDYVLAEAKLQASELYQRSRDYWVSRLPHLPPAPELPLAIDPARLARPRFVPRLARMEATKWQLLKARGARAGLTPSGILLAAFAEVLSTWSKNPRFCINLTLFNRLPLHEQVNEIVGDFSSLLLLAVDNSLAQEVFEQRAKRLQEQLWSDFDHLAYSGVRVLRDLARLRRARAGALPTGAIMPVVFTSVLGQQTTTAYPAPWQEIIYSIAQTPQVWLDHQVMEEAGALLLSWQAVEALFPPGLVDEMFETYTHLLERLATEEEVWQSQSCGLLPASQFAQRAQVNATSAPLSIELGEIEQTLLLHPAVHAAVVTTMTEPLGEKHLAPIAKSLIAYVVLQSDNPAKGKNHDEALHHLAARFSQTCIRKEMDAPVIDLAQSTDKPELLRRYRERISYRTFLPEPIPFQQFSDFLRSLGRIELEGLPKYLYPSADGVYPVQTYVSIKEQRVTGIPEGTYYYNPQSSQLVLLSDNGHLNSRIHAPINQTIFDESAFSLFLIGDLTTISSLHGDVARDFCLLEAGYMSQLLMMRAAEYHIGLCPVGGLDFTQIRDVFKLTDRHLFLHSLLGGYVDPSSAIGWSFLLGEKEKATTLQPAEAGQAQADRDRRDDPLRSSQPLHIPTVLRRFLAEKLPAYMLPSAIMVLDSLPLTANGKVDRKYFPLFQIQSGRKETGYREPTSEVEQTIAAVWQEVLDRAQVGVHDNFFDLGGNSLLMVRAYVKIREALRSKPIGYNRDLSIIEMFFQYPTIHILAEFLTQGVGQQAQSALPEAQEERPRVETHNRAQDGSTMAHRRTGTVSKGTFPLLPTETQKMPHADVSATDIAIVGMSCRLPGCKNIHEFWQNLQDGKECVSPISDEQLRAALLKSLGYIPEEDLTRWLNDPSYVRMAAGLEDIDLFAATFFGYNPTEAELIDPQQRIFLESAWEALEDAAYDPQTYSGSIGVYAGSEMSVYHYALHTGPIPSLGGILELIGNANDYLATRVSYKLNLKGPSLTVQSACSTSLVAIHVACQSLKSRECDMALAGSVVARPIQEMGYFYQEEGYLSPDGHCRPFDAQAQGTLFANGGVGVVVLKRLTDALADGDHVYAVIKGSAVNNDGSVKTGYTAPSIGGQVKVLSDAMVVAAVDPTSISYVEAHGTATPLGDPIEVAALTQAFGTSCDSAGSRTRQKNFCALGSLKSNMGHLGPVAGVAGLIKTSLALKHKMLPPSLHYEQPNPHIDFAHGPFYVNTQLAAWTTSALPRRAGVSSFGIGGTNAHVILEEAPDWRGARDRSYQPSWEILILSAKTSSALEQMRINLLDYLKNHPDLNLADLAFTLQVGRKAFPHRLMLVCQTLAEAASQLEAKQGFLSVAPPGEQSVIFMFPGQGPQYVNMGRELYEAEPIFRDQIDTCASLLLPHLHYDLREVLYPSSGQEEVAQQQLDYMFLAQSAVFVVEYALAQLWMQRGIRPAAMIGHSIGEYVTACLAGVLSLRDALFLVALRGQLMDQLESGAMLAVSLSEEKVLPLLSARLSLAVHNSATDCVVSGPVDDIEHLQRSLLERQITCRLLRVSRASHSQMLEPILAQFTHEVQKLHLHPPMIPYISNLTGKWITEQEATDPGYWAKHWRQTVRFAEGIQLLLDSPATVLLEVGPGRSLGTFAQQIAAVGTGSAQGTIPTAPVLSPTLILPSLRHPQAPVSDVAFFLNTCGQLWCAGVAIDWAVGTGSAPVRVSQRRRISLPTYPFERERYWIFPNRRAGTGPVPTASSAQVQVGKKPNIAEWFSVPSWKRSPLSGVQALAEQPEHKDCWLIFTDSLGLGDRLAESLLGGGHGETGRDKPVPLRAVPFQETVVTVKAGAQFGHVQRDGPDGRTGARHCPYGPNIWEYTLRPECREDYERLLNEISSQGMFPTRIVHLWTLIAPDQVPSDLETCETAQTLGFYSQLFLVQALGKQEGEQPLEITLVSNNLLEVQGGEVLCPARATALGVGKVAPHEYPHMTFRYIDVVFPETNPQAQGTVLKQLVAELLARSSDSVVAYRGPYRWVPCIEPVSLEAGADDKQPQGLRQRGVYLITGGLGGIGLSIAFDLARSVKANLVLTGRTDLPPRAEWEHRLATARRDSALRLSDPVALRLFDPVAHKIRQVLALEELGSQVLVARADVTDLAQMQAVIAQVRERFGALHGVIHAAGLAGGGLMQLKTPEVAAKVLAPKVRGTLVLETVLRDMHPDFLVLCSSLYSVLGGIGQVDYCAANTFLDSFAFYNSSQNGTRTISINWDSWQEVGMAVDVPASYEKSPPISLSNGQYQLNNKTPQRLQDGIQPQEGVEALGRILSHPVLPQVIVSPRDIQALRTTPLPPLLDLDDGRLASPSSVLHQRPNLPTAYVSPRNEMEQQIAAIWQKVLGLAQIGVQDNFFAVGGDSLMGLRTMNELRKVFGVNLSITLLFKKNPTIEGMAEIIRRKQRELLGDEQLAELLKQVSQMSEEEAMQLLEQNFAEGEKKE